MRYHAIFAAWLCLTQVRASEESPRIIIVGCGASGIAAATRLIENGFTNITILEAEDRIGGRVYTTPFAGYMVDLGGQWVYCHEDNLSYDMAWPLGLIEHSVPMNPIRVFDSSGSPLPEDLASGLIHTYMNITEEDIPDSNVNKTLAEHFRPKIEEFLTSQPELTESQRKSLTEMVDLFVMGEYAGDTWSHVAVNPEEECKGDLAMNWKERGYSTILDILMKKYPDPTQELPVLNKTVLNTEVSKINYNAAVGDVRVTTANGNEYSADHVIVTPSIGVLRADYETLFDPPLPEAKINAIKHIELGAVVKIFLSYPEPWWTKGDNNPIFNFYWREEDKSEYANDPEKSWMLGLIYITTVEHKPRLLCAWVTGLHIREMVNIPDDRIFEQTKEFLRRFLGKTHNLTEPTEMLRSKWLGNKNFRGTWSYNSLETVRSGAKPHDLSVPIIKDGKPLLLFAGEATHSNHSGTVHGAIATGWREADRLIKLYADRKSSTT